MKHRLVVRDFHAISVTVATVLFMARDYDAAIEQFEKTVALEPTFFSAHPWLGNVYAGKGMYHEAIRSVERAVDECKPDKPGSTKNRVLEQARSGR